MVYTGPVGGTSDSGNVIDTVKETAQNAAASVTSVSPPSLGTPGYSSGGGGSSGGSSSGGSGGSSSDRPLADRGSDPDANRTAAYLSQMTGSAGVNIPGLGSGATASDVLGNVQTASQEVVVDRVQQTAEAFAGASPAEAARDAVDHAEDRVTALAGVDGKLALAAGAALGAVGLAAAVGGD